MKKLIKNIIYKHNCSLSIKDKNIIKYWQHEGYSDTKIYFEVNRIIKSSSPLMFDIFLYRWSSNKSHKILNNVNDKFKTLKPLSCTYNPNSEWKYQYISDIDKEINPVCSKLVFDIKHKSHVFFTDNNEQEVILPSNIKFIVDSVKIEPFYVSQNININIKTLELRQVE